MIVGVPKEIKKDENRVALTPEGVQALVKQGHSVWVQKSAGEGSGFGDDLYEEAGAILTENIAQVYAQAQLIVKVKEPIEAEFDLLKEEQILFTYLHLAAALPLTKLLIEKRITAFAYETLEVDRRLPLLEPMSEVAGKMAALNGAFYLGRIHGGSGKLLGGTVGTERNQVLILGGGTAGKAAAQVAAAMGADVTVVDLNVERLHYLESILPKNVTVRIASEHLIESLLPTADVVIGTVLLPGAKAPRLITKEMLKLLNKGSVLVDVSIDQGGCFETSHPTTHSDPIYVVDGIIHYCVANMPGAYPRTSTLALTSVTLPYIVQLAKLGVAKILESAPAMVKALNVYQGSVTQEGVIKALKNGV